MNIYELINKLDFEDSSSFKHISGCRDFSSTNEFGKLQELSKEVQEVEKPWSSDPNYFKTAYISSLALMKICEHANRGSTIEVMGMLIGKISKGAIIVVDAYPLPVEGTETRVNAQAEGYEYMVQYLDLQKQIGKRENIVGWYHSHPGYGCWLSGIDVSTQQLNQNFQDPYLAIVVDPLRTIESGEVDIGAFRSYPEGYKKGQVSKRNNQKEIPQSKKNEFGAHSDKYYSLQIKYFRSELDLFVLDFVSESSWADYLAQSKKANLIRERDLTKSINDITEKLRQIKPLNTHKMQEVHLRRFDSNFHNLIQEGLEVGSLRQAISPDSLHHMSPLSSDDEMNSDQELSQKPYRQKLVSVSNDSINLDEVVSIDSGSNSLINLPGMASKLLSKSECTNTKSDDNQAVGEDNDVEMNNRGTDFSLIYESDLPEGTTRIQDDDLVRYSETTALPKYTDTRRKSALRKSHFTRDSSKSSKTSSQSSMLPKSHLSIYSQCNEIKTKELRDLLFMKAKLDLFAPQPM